jgi:hypothetical protein
MELLRGLIELLLGLEVVLLWLLGLLGLDDLSGRVVKLDWELLGNLRGGLSLLLRNDLLRNNVLGNNLGNDLLRHDLVVNNLLAFLFELLVDDLLRNDLLGDDLGNDLLGNNLLAFDELRLDLLSLNLNSSRDCLPPVPVSQVLLDRLLLLLLLLLLLFLLVDIFTLGLDGGDGGGLGLSVNLSGLPVDAVVGLDAVGNGRRESGCRHGPGRLGLLLFILLLLLDLVFLVGLPVLDLVLLDGDLLLWDVLLLLLLVVLLRLEGGLLVDAVDAVLDILVELALRPGGHGRGQEQQREELHGDSENSRTRRGTKAALGLSSGR